MKFLNVFFIGLLLFSVACSNKKAKEDETTAASLVDEEVSDELLAEDLSDENIIIEDDEELLLEEEPTLAESEPASEATSEESYMAKTEPETSSSIEINNSDVQTYTVEKNDTLMWIAFKIYGDYAYWKNLAQMNSDKLGAGNAVREGMQLQYNPPAVEFVWNPKGNPYLIKRGDTLGLISNSVYGTKSKWRSIYTNNKPLIKDPNLIFAGFTIYYLASGELDEVALNN